MPPLAFTVTIELPPLHRIGVLDELGTSAVGWVIFPVVVPVQLLASVTVYEYVPAERVNVPVPVKGGVPPVALTVTVELPPLHRIGVLDELALTAGVLVMITGSLVIWQSGFPRSFTVTVCEPGLTSVYSLGEVHDANEPLSSWHSKGPVPPEKVAVTVPNPVLQAGLVPVASTTKPALKET